MVTLEQNDGNDSMTRVVVSDVQVLTAGTRYDQEKARDGQPIPTTVVTLLVTPPDAERIALAASEGHDHADAAQSDGPHADGDRRHPDGGAASAGAGAGAGREDVREGRRVAVPAAGHGRSRSAKVYTVETIEPRSARKRSSVNDISFPVVRIAVRQRRRPAARWPRR